MKKQFNLQDWLKDKSQNIETRDGRPARIICTDAKADDGACIIALIPGYGGEEAYQFFPDGRAFSSKSSDEDCADLFLVTPEPELTEFENAFGRALMEVPEPDDEEEWYPFLKEKAAELLEIGRKEIIKQGNIVIPVDDFNERLCIAMERARKEALKEAKEGQERMIAEAANRGRMLALKELADYGHAQYKMGRDSVMQTAIRWRIWENGACGNSKGRPIALVHRGEYRLVDCLGVTGEKYIMLSDLEKLPGFKENSYE